LKPSEPADTVAVALVAAALSVGMEDSSAVAPQAINPGRSSANIRPMRVRFLAVRGRFDIMTRDKNRRSCARRPVLSTYVGRLFAAALLIAWTAMATQSTTSEPTPQRLATIRDQLKLLADYL
jgi:hypothetical protein